MSVLLAGGAHADPLDSHGATPLHHAIKGLHHGAVSLLLAHDADATWKDLHGRSCLDVIPPLPQVRLTYDNHIKTTTHNTQQTINSNKRWWCLKLTHECARVVFLWVSSFISCKSLAHASS